MRVLSVRDVSVLQNELRDKVIQTAQYTIHNNSIFI